MENFDLRKYLAKNKLIKEEISENQLDQIEDWKFQDGWGFIEDYRREDESGPNKKIAFLAYNSEEEEELPPGPGQSLNVGSLDKLTPNIDQQLVNRLKVDYLPSARKITKDMIKKEDVDMVIVVNHKVNNNTIIQ
jgi:hypothetical protein